MKISFFILTIGSDKCCITIELIQVKELILLKVTTVNNVFIVTIALLIECLKFKIMFVMFVMIWGCRT